MLVDYTGKWFWGAFPRRHSQYMAEVLPFHEAKWLTGISCLMQFFGISLKELCFLRFEVDLVVTF